MLFLPVPLGAAESDGRVARATLALVVVNAVAFALSLGALGRAEKVEAEVQQIEELAAWSLEKAAVGRPGLEQAVTAYPGALEFLQAEPSTWRSALAGEPAALAELEGYLAEAGQLRADSPFFHRFGFVPARITPAGLLVHMFLHGGLLHLLGNMVFLWAIGGFLEKSWGPAPFLALYFVSGLAAALTHAVTHRASLEPAIGASGAIAGLMGACAVRFPRERIRLLLVYALGLVPRVRVVAVPSLVFLGFWLLEQLFWTSLTSGMRVEVAYAAHLGGFAFGALATIATRPPPQRILKLKGR